MCHDKAQPLRNKAIFKKKKKRKKDQGILVTEWSFSSSQPAPVKASLYIFYIYIYNIESVFVKKYFNDHIYLSRHDGFRKGGGGSIMGELRGKNRKRRLG